MSFTEGSNFQERNEKTKSSNISNSIAKDNQIEVKKNNTHKGFIVFDSNKKPVLDTFQDHEDFSKMSANLYYNKQWWELDKKGFLCKKVILEIKEV